VVVLGPKVSAAFGFLVGEIYGDLHRHRKCLQQANHELRERLEKGAARADPIDLTPQPPPGCCKRPGKTLVVIPTKSMAGSQRSGRSKTYTFKDMGMNGAVLRIESSDI
jgi:hypothetical protein